MPYTEEELDRILAKGDKVRGKDPDLYRKDACGNGIYRHSYGKETPIGWEVDHLNSKEYGSTNCCRNMKPLQSRENSRKGATYPYKKK